jgi:hypothetical protein
MSRPNKEPDKVDPLPDEERLEDLASEWAGEDRKLENRKPDLGEVEEDPSEL